MAAERFLVLFITLHHAVVSEKLAIIAASLSPSSLFGSQQLGKPFDDGVSTVGLHSLSVGSGPQFVFGVQATYLLENGSKFSGAVHGTIDQFAENSTTIIFQGDGEQIRRISGAVEPVYGYITKLKLYTSDARGYTKVYGPFGAESNCHTPFTVAGTVVGLFGRSDKYLNALGAYLNPMVTPMYNRTQMIGGIFGETFDDYPVLSSGVADMVNITINAGAYINGLAITYQFPNGTLFNCRHGVMGPNDVVIRFSSHGERIVQMDVAIFSLFVNYLMFSTLDSRGIERVYGPYGGMPQSNITTIHGTVYGFYGRVGVDHNITAVTGLGFYI